MEEMDYKQEARLLIQVVLREIQLMFEQVNNAANVYFKEIDTGEGRYIEQGRVESLEPIPGFSLMPANQFSPFLKLMELSAKLKQKFGKDLYILIIEATYNTKRGDQVELFLQEDQWSDRTKQIYNLLVKTVAEWLKEGKLKPFLE